MLYIYVHICAFMLCMRIFCLFAFCSFGLFVLRLGLYIALAILELSTSYPGTHCVDPRTHRDPLPSAGNSQHTGCRCMCGHMYMVGAVFVEGGRVSTNRTGLAGQLALEILSLSFEARFICLDSHSHRAESWRPWPPTS